MYYGFGVTDRETPPPKKDVARALLLRGSVFVYLDPRGGEVKVPPWLARQPQLVLQVGLDLPVPIPDLRVDDAGVYGTLSFNRAPYTCSVPWTAVFALVGDDGMGMVWREDLPEEIAAEVELGLARAQSDLRPDHPRPSAAPRLRAIEGGAAPTRSAEPKAGAGVDEVEPSQDGDIERSQDGDNESGRRRPPYLRVIK